MNKKCIKCNKVKPISEFYKSKAVKNGLRSTCKSCCLKYQRKWRKTPKGIEGEKRQKGYYKTQKYRDAILKYRYGLTRKQHQQKYIEQNGCCYICKEPVPYEEIDTDHNHITGQLRQLLCHRCNIFAGKIEKSRELTYLIINYLDEHS